MTQARLLTRQKMKISVVCLDHHLQQAELVLTTKCSASTSTFQIVAALASKYPANTLETKENMAD